MSKQGRPFTDRAFRLLDRLDHPLAVGALSYLLAVAIGISLLFRRHIDANWDLLNYHIASAHLLLHDGAWQHVRPSGIQTYFSPFINLPTYLGLSYLGPIWLRLAYVLWQGLTWPILLSAFWRILRAERVPLAISRPRATIALLLVLAGLGNLNLSVLGTSYADLTIAVFIAAAFALVQSGGFAPDPRRGLVAGALLGLSTGLKLTALVTVLPLGVSLYATSVVAKGCSRRLFIDMLAFGIGFAVTAGVLLGPWMAKIAEVTGNPIFPYLNSYFRSPLGSVANWSDQSFLPHGMRDWLYRPIGIALGQAGLMTEVPLREVRWVILLYCVAPIGLIAGLLALARDRRSAIVACPGTFCVALWSALSLAIWAKFFFIGRYIPIIDMCAGLLILRVLLAVNMRWSVGLAVAAAAAAVLTLAPPNWGSRGATADGTRRYVDAQPAFRKALVFLAAPPMGWTLPYLGERSRAVLRLTASAAQDGGYASMVDDLLKYRWPDGVWLLSYDRRNPGSRPYLTSYGLTLTDACRPVDTWYTRLWACRIDRA